MKRLALIVLVLAVLILCDTLSADAQQFTNQGGTQINNIGRRGRLHSRLQARVAARAAFFQPRVSASFAVGHAAHYRPTVSASFAAYAPPVVQQSFLVPVQAMTYVQRSFAVPDPCPPAAVPVDPCAAPAAAFFAASSYGASYGAARGIHGHVPARFFR